MSVVLIPHSVMPLINASFSFGLVSLTSAPTAICLELYFCRRYVAVALPIR